jgi:cob(I)alamin adenosyltransferase
MVVLNKIYTRTGDAGTTALGSGERVPKHAARIAAYGTVDETNAFIGVARLHVRGEHPDVDAMLGRIQNDLFDLGADLTVPERTLEQASAPARERLRVSETQVERLEDEIDRMNGELSPLRSFVLPGGSAAAAALHVARTVCRRAERCMVELAGEPNESVGAPALKYINRLSDLLFVASRYVNERGRGDVLWVPGQNR